MKALISPLENNRIAQVAAQDFPIAEPLYWIDCPDNCTTDWTYDGLQFNEPEQPVYITPIPTTVSMRQARLALLQIGLLSDVENAIAQGSQADQITWEYATEVNRSDVLVINMSAALGLSEAQLDALFTLAAGL